MKGATFILWLGGVFALSLIALPFIGLATIGIDGATIAQARQEKALNGSKPVQNLDVKPKPTPTCDLPTLSFDQSVEENEAKLMPYMEPHLVGLDPMVETHDTMVALYYTVLNAHGCNNDEYKHKWLVETTLQDWAEAPKTAAYNAQIAAEVEQMKAELAANPPVDGGEGGDSHVGAGCYLSWRLHLHCGIGVHS
jgi:hypothetical protein